LGPELERRFDGVYFLPRPRYDKNLPGYPLPNHISIWYRKDWTDAIGFPSKEAYTTSEVIELARQIKLKDPGNLGSRLVSLTARPEFAMRLFIQSNSTHFNNFYKDKTGTYQWGPASQDTLLGLKLWYRAFAEGILDPEFFALKDQEDINKFVSAGIAGALNGEATGIHRYLYREQIFAPQTGNPPEALGVATVLGEDGYYHLEDLINYWGCYIFSPNLTDDEFYRILDNMDFFSTEQGYLMAQMGFEGIDWEYKDGEYVSLVPADTLLSDKYPRMGSSALSVQLPDDFSFESPVWPRQYGQEIKEAYAYMIEHSTLDTLSPIDWDLYCYDSPVMRRARAYSFDQEFANLITRATSETNLETIWKAWIQTQAPIIQPALDELNTKLKK
jgi:putative aldouronate transport system substrate-binding protein